MNSPAIIKQRRDTATNWSNTNPVLYDGQLGIDTTNKKIKIGDGTTAWNSLPYLDGSPSDADYLVKTANSVLSAERVVGNSTSITANWGTAGAVTFERAAFTGDVTANANSNSLTIANKAVSFAKIQDSAAAGLSVIGRNTNSVGVFAEIAAANDEEVLRRSGTTLAFGTITAGGIANGAVQYSKIQNVATSRLLGRATAGSGVVEEISLTSPLIFSSGALAFKVSSANNCVLFNNSASDLSTSANFTFNSTTNKLSVSGGLVSDLIETTGLFYLNSTAANGTGIFAVFSNAPSNGVAAVSIGNTSHNNGSLVVYGTSTITGAVRLGSSGSGNIQDNAGNNRISFTSTDTTLSGDLTVSGNDIKSSSATAITLSGADVTVVGDLTVTGNDIKSSSSATAITLSADDITVPGNITANEGYRISSSAINAQTGTTYTLVAADNGKIVTCNNSSAITVTVPSGLGAGFTCTIIALGTGKVTLSQTSQGTTLNWYGGTGNVTIAGQYGSAALLAYAANTFSVSGTLQ